MKRGTKLFLYIAVIIILLLSAVYAMLFTPPGNNLMRPIIESRLSGKISGLTIPKFRLTPNKIELLIDIGKNSVISLKGAINILHRSVNLKYNVNIKDLSKLSNLTSVKLLGSLETTGELSGGIDKLLVNGSSDIFGSKTKYKAVFSKFELKTANISLKSAHIGKILYLKGNPSYIKGLIDIDATLSTKGDNLFGVITSRTRNARFNHIAINKSWNMKMDKDYRLTMQTRSIVKNDLITSKINFKSSLLNFKADKNRFNLKNKTVRTDYLVNIPDLQKLKFATGQDLRGHFSAAGTILKTDKLLAGTSKLPFGFLSFKLRNSILKANIRKVNVSKLLYTLGFFRIFRSMGNINLTYDLSRKSGRFGGKFINGRIYADRLAKLVKQFTHFDITKELYKTAQVNGTILKNIITANLNMRSSNTKISSSGTKIDLNNNRINSKLQFAVRKIKFGVHVYGYIRKPKINIDVSKFIKSKIESKIKKRLNKIIKSKKLKNILNGFFK